MGGYLCKNIENYEPKGILKWEMGKGDCISKAPNRAIVTPIFRAFASSLKCLLISAWDNGSIFCSSYVGKSFIAPLWGKNRRKNLFF